MLVDKDVESSFWIVDDVSKSLENGWRPVLDFLKNSLKSGQQRIYFGFTNYDLNGQQVL